LNKCSQSPNIFEESQSGGLFHKSPELLLPKDGNVFHSLLISISCCIAVQKCKNHITGRTKQNLPVDISQNEPMGRINENSTDIQEGLSN